MTRLDDEVLLTFQCMLTIRKDWLTSSITTTRDGGPVKNLIGRSSSDIIPTHSGAALVERIISAAKSGRKFKIYVLIPEVPYVQASAQTDSAAPSPETFRRSLDSRQSWKPRWVSTSTAADCSTVLSTRAVTRSLTGFAPRDSTLTSTSHSSTFEATTASTIRMLSSGRWSRMWVVVENALTHLVGRDIPRGPSCSGSRVCRRTFR